MSRPLFILCKNVNRTILTIFHSDRNSDRRFQESSIYAVRRAVYSGFESHSLRIICIPHFWHISERCVNCAEF